MKQRTGGILIVIVPICIYNLEVDLTETSHQRDLPKDGLDPWSTRCDLDAPFLRVVGEGVKRDLDLFGLEPVLLQIVEIVGSQIRKRLLQPGVFFVSQPELLIRVVGCERCVIGRVGDRSR
jgi:hypothetical protein